MSTLFITLVAVASNLFAQAPPAKSESGRYALVSTGDTVVKLDTATGQSWILKRSGDSAAWVAIQSPAGTTATERSGPPSPEAAAERTRGFLERFDRNKDGRLSKEEFPAFLGQDRFDAMDANKDGLVDLQEFTKGMDGARNRFGGGR